VLRCNLCGQEVKSNKKIIKWPAQAKSAVVVNRLYGTPWHRTATIQNMYNIPVPASTQWGLFKDVWTDVGRFVSDELYKHAANSMLFNTDDTGYKILEILQSNKDLPEKEQRACHTTVICGQYEGYKIIFYMTANKYCYENWKPLLDERKTPEKAVIMTDASAMSTPKEEDENGYIRLINDESTYSQDEVNKGNEIAVVKQSANQLKVIYKKADDTVGDLIVEMLDKKSLKIFSLLTFDNCILIRNKKANKKVYDFIYNAISLKGDHADLGKVYSAICLGGHAHRRFKDAKKYYPEHAGFFVEKIQELYGNDYACKGKSSIERLQYHQEHSTPIIDSIYSKISELFEKKLVEPNDALGAAMQYMLNHKEGLTLFLRVAGVPLDNNWAERKLRIIAMLRNTALFYKTISSAEISSDLFSIVETCKSNAINPVLYLNWLQDNWQQVQENPGQYLPWHFAARPREVKVA